MPNAWRPYARLGQPIVEPCGRAVSEIGADHLMNRAEHLQQNENRADQHKRAGEGMPALARPRPAHPSRSQRPPAGFLGAVALSTRRRRARLRLWKDAEKLPLFALGQPLEHPCILPQVVLGGAQRHWIIAECLHKDSLVS